MNDGRTGVSAGGPDPATTGPGSGAAKPVTEPPGGAVDRVLNDEAATPDGQQEPSEPASD